MRDKIINYILITFIALLILLGSGIVSAGNTLINYNSQVQKNGVAHNGNATFFIFDASSGGTKFYEESFNGSISQGLLQAMLGYQNQSLALIAGNMYFMDVYIDGQDTNATVNGTNSDRFPFIAPVNAYQTLNISKLIVNGGDADDAVNITGGLIVNDVVNITAMNPGIALNVNNQFTVENNGVVTIREGGPGDGKVLMLSSDSDDALNVSAGGVYIEGATVINNDLTVSGGAFSSFSNKVLVSNNDPDDALNVSAGGAYISGNLVVDGAVTMNNPSSTINNVPVSNYDTNSEWVFVSETNFTAGNYTIGNLPFANVYKIIYYANITVSSEEKWFIMRVNNVTTGVYDSYHFDDGAATDEILSSIDATYWTLYTSNSPHEKTYGKIILSRNYNNTGVTYSQVSNTPTLNDYWYTGHVDISQTSISDITIGGSSPITATVLIYRNRFMG